MPPKGIAAQRSSNRLPTGTELGQRSRRCFQIGNGIGALGEKERDLGRREPIREELEQWLRRVRRRHALEFGSKVRENRVIGEEWLPASRNHCFMGRAG